MTIDRARRRLLTSACAGTTLAALAAWSRAATATAANESVIRVGQSAVFSGPSANLGFEMKQGIDACFAATNRAGGVFGKSLKLISLDDGYEPDRAAANTVKLIDEANVFALLGYVGTPTSLAAMPIFDASKIPFVGAFTGASAIRMPFNKYVFNVRASYIDEGGPLIRALTPFGFEKVAIFHQNDAYGDAVRQSMEMALKARGMAPIAYAKVERNSIDVTQAAAVIARSGATAVVMGSVYAPSAELIKRLRAMNVFVNYGSVSFVGTSSLLELYPVDSVGLAISQVMPSPEFGEVPITREYQKAMFALGQTKLTYGSIEGYIAAKVFIEGLRRAGPVLSRSRLIAALETFDDYDTGGFGVSFSPTNHNGSSFAEVTMIGANRKLVR